MKKLFQTVGIITLMCFSFFYTEKTAKVVKEYDEIMIEIRKNEKNYYNSAKDATIINNTIVPGLVGREVDASKSYNKMKRYGKYEESLLVFKTIKPDVSVEDNLNKYIVSGNKNKQAVAIVLLIKNNDYIDDVIDILDDKKVKANFFFEGSIIDDNKDLIKDLVYDEHNVGNLGFNGSYSDSNYTWTNVYLKKLQSKSYCYTEKENKEILDICTLNKNMTIIPSIKLSGSIDKNFKNKLQNGSIISIELNDTTMNELSTLINYIGSKGYELKTLDDLLKE